MVEESILLSGQPAATSPQPPVRTPALLASPGRLLGLAQMALLALDGNGRVMRWGPEAECLFGHSADLVVGTPFSELFHVPGESGALLGRTLDDLCASAVTAMRADHRQRDDIALLAVTFRGLGEIS